jgi:transcription elongation factor Elf1
VTEPENPPAAPEPQSHQSATFTCPHCGHAQVVQIRASEVVTIGKCPNCGELVAPAKKH